VETLIEFMGGEKTFESRLDLMVSTRVSGPHTITDNIYSSNQTCLFKTSAQMAQP
jgi:hypothetical protein